MRLDLAELLARCPVPQPHPEGTAGGQRASVGRTGNPNHPVIDGEMQQLLASGGVPAAERLVPAARKQSLAVRREGEATDPATVTRTRQQLPALAHVPEANVRPFCGASQKLPVRGECKAAITIPQISNLPEFPPGG